MTKMAIRARRIRRRSDDAFFERCNLLSHNPGATAFRYLGVDDDDAGSTMTAVGGDGDDVGGDGDGGLDGDASAAPWHDRSGDGRHDGPVDDGGRPDRLLVCPVPHCDAGGEFGCFDSRERLDDHYSAVHAELECSECGRVLPTRYLLDLHIEECHDTFFALAVERAAARRHGNKRTTAPPCLHATEALGVFTAGEEGETSNREDRPKMDYLPYRCLVEHCCYPPPTAAAAAATDPNGWVSCYARFASERERIRHMRIVHGYPKFFRFHCRSARYRTNATTDGDGGSAKTPSRHYGGRHNWPTKNRQRDKTKKSRGRESKGKDRGSVGPGVMTSVQEGEALAQDLITIRRDATCDDQRMEDDVHYDGERSVSLSDVGETTIVPEDEDALMGTAEVVEVDDDGDKEEGGDGRSLRDPGAPILHAPPGIGDRAYRDAEKRRRQRERRKAKKRAATPCRFFFRVGGTCRYGESCLFSHDEDKASAAAGATPVASRPCPLVVVGRSVDAAAHGGEDLHTGKGSSDLHGSGLDEATCRRGYIGGREASSQDPRDGTGDVYMDIDDLASHLSESVRVSVPNRISFGRRRRT